MPKIRSVFLVLIFIISTPINGLAGELADILYINWGRLCSISPVSDNKPVCSNFMEECDSPSWQPRGTQIVVEAGEHDGPKKLVLLSSDGTLIKPLAQSSGFIRPVWSPNGKFIYALSYELKNSIGRWDGQGENFRQISIKGADNQYEYLQMISFSPSGKLAAILTDKFKRMLIAELQGQSFSVKKILPRDFKYVSQSAWLDDNHLLFVGGKESNRGELWELNIGDESIKKIGIAGLWLRDFITLSSDNKSVAVCAMPDNHKIPSWNLWKYDLDSASVTRLTKGTNGAEDVDPFWRK